MEQASGSLLDTSLPASIDAPTALRGLPLLDLVLHQIDLSPESWNQESWRCGTGMCLAGWAATLAGGTWAAAPNSFYADYLVADAQDEEWELEITSEIPGQDFVHVRERAARLLELDEEVAGDLFNANNDITYLHKVRDWLANPVGPSPMHLHAGPYSSTDIINTVANALTRLNRH